MNPSIVQQFLWRVRQRQRIVALAGQARLFLLIALGTFAGALLCSRFFGLLPGWFTPVTLAAFLAAALVLACVFYRRTDITEAARLADARMNTHDLFLTASQIDHSLGAYQDLVLVKAEERVAKVAPKDVVPYRWQQGTLRVFVAVALLALGVYFLPQFDPFGLHQERRQVAEQRDRMRELNKATEVRAALLAQKTSGEQTEAVKQAIAELEKAFQGAKPNDKAGTLARLNQQQKVF